MRQKYLLLFGPLRHHLRISPARSSLTIISLDAHPQPHQAPADFYLHQEAIQPVGGLASYRVARQLFAPIQSVLMENMAQDADIYILGSTTCIVSNCIPQFLQQLGSKHRLAIGLAEPFWFESDVIPPQGIRLIDELKGFESSLCQLVTCKSDNHIRGKSDFSFEKVLQAMVKNLLWQLGLIGN